MRKVRLNIFLLTQYSEKKGFAKKLLKLVKDKTGNKLTFQKPISPLGQKLIKTIEKWS